MDWDIEEGQIFYVCPEVDHIHPKCMPNHFKTDAGDRCQQVQNDCWKGFLAGAWKYQGAIEQHIKQPKTFGLDKDEIDAILVSLEYYYEKSLSPAIGESTKQHARDAMLDAEQAIFRIYRKMATPHRDDCTCVFCEKDVTITRHFQIAPEEE
jgi:hypothetical protein